MPLLLRGRLLVATLTVTGAALLGASIGGLSSLDRSLAAAVAAPVLSTVEVASPDEQRRHDPHHHRRGARDARPEV